MEAKKKSQKELEKEIEVLTFERDALHKNYVNARQDTARELLNLLLDEPWNIYIAEDIVYEIARDVYKLKVEKGRIV